MLTNHAEPSVHVLLDQLQEQAGRPAEAASGMPASIYRCESIAALEKERIFRRDWVCPGLAAEIPNAGDYITFSIADEPVFCVRDSAGEVRTFSNVCRHRMMQLVSGRGRAGRIVCPYHAWTYNLDGRLIGAAHMSHSTAFEKSKICLPEIRTEIWHGWIYVTLNDQAPSVADALAPLEKRVRRYQMASYVPVIQEEHVWQTNWKLLTENFMEGYHLPVAHQATVGAWFPTEETMFPKKFSQYFTYQTFVKSEAAKYGRAHRSNKRLRGKWRNTSILPTVFPCHMYVLAPDHLWYLSLRPKGVGQVNVRFGVAIAPEVHAECGHDPEWLADLASFFDHVNGEDRFVVEGIFAGAQSGFAQPGPLSWLEREIHDFTRYLAVRLAT